MQNKWDERYSDTNFFYGVDPNSFLVEQIRHFKPDSKILCIGDGEGRNSVYLAKQGLRVTALDLSQVGLEKMQKLASKNGTHVTPVLADLNDYQFAAGAWDAVVSIWCHTPSALRHQVHQAIFNALPQGGIFVLEAYTPDQLKYKTGGPQDVDMLVTLKELQSEFKGWQWLHAQEMIRDVQEGIGHKGPSAVVQFVAKKP